MRPTPALLAFSLAACATTTPPASAPVLRCDAAAVQGFVGQQATQDVGARMLSASGATNLRWVAHGMMVTMDYREGRLTVQLDATNRIASTSCT